VRELWGLEPHQVMSPILEEKIRYTATVTYSFELAARLAAKWDSPVDDAVIHDHARRKGTQAMRVERALSPDTRGEVVAEAKRDAPPETFSLVIMMDGAMLRERGPDWGLKPPQTKANRGAWHELKGAIIYRLGQRMNTQSGRWMILDKCYVAYRGEPFEFGRRVHAEALRRGLHQAEKVYVIADGAVLIWNIVADRFGQATCGLDIHHASAHLWAVAHDQFGETGTEARVWVEPLLHQLKHGAEHDVLQALENLRQTRAEREQPRRPVTQREINYAANSQTNSTRTANTCITNNCMPRAARSARARWSRRAANSKTASNPPASSGPCAANNT